MAKKTTNPYKNRICNHAQVGGIETSVLDDGLGRGVRIAWVNTGSGLRFKVVIDRAMDIADAFFNQYSLAWISPPGITRPRPDANRGLEWLYGFAGGLVATCGLTHAGGPESDENEERGLHGRISSMPAQIESIVQPDPANGKLDMSITGLIKQARLFGPNYLMRRTISARIGEPTIRIKDVITNRHTLPQPHMFIYHCNFGWPLADEGADIVWKGKCKSRGLDMDNELFNKKHDYKKCCDSLESHRGGEACGFIDVEPNGRGVCTVGLANRKLGLAVKMTYPKKNLPWLCNWQHWGFGDYVTGIEPGTNPPIGQNAARKKKQLVMLEPGQSRTYQLDLTVLTDEKKIENFVRQYGG